MQLPTNMGRYKHVRACAYHHHSEDTTTNGGGGLLVIIIIFGYLFPIVYLMHAPFSQGEVRNK